MNKHDWLLNEDKTININYLDYNTHNGPFCKVCRKFFCVNCDEIENLVCEKDSKEWSPIGGELANSIINRKGHND
jgi:hypothetical protein